METTTGRDLAKQIEKAYQRMELLPGQLAQIVAIYSQQIAQEKTRHANALASIEAEYEGTKTVLQTNRNQAYDEADVARTTIMQQLDKLRYEMDYQRDRYTTSFQNLKGNKKSLFPRYSNGFKSAIAKVESKKYDSVDAFEAAIKRLAEQEDQLYAEKITEIDSRHKMQLGEAAKEYGAKLDKENQKTSDNKNTFFETARATIEGMNPEQLGQQYKMLELSKPAIENFEVAQNIPEALDMGYIMVDLTEWRSKTDGEPVVNLFREYFSFALREVNGRAMLMFPYGNSYADNRINKIVVYDETSKAQAFDFIKSIEMRMFMSSPCGKLRVAMMDPVELGANFSMFACLGDDDERIISTRIWCDQDRIKEQLKMIINQIAHVNQDCLRKEFDNIVAYNDYVGKNAEPVLGLFIVDFPRNFDAEACGLLEQIVSSGPKCGIYTYIAASVQDLTNCQFDLSGIRKAVEMMNFDQGRLRYNYTPEIRHFVSPVSLPDREHLDEIFEALINGIKTSDRIIIYFDEIADGLTKNREKWFKFDDANGIDIPIGQEGASRNVSIHLGGELITQHHALISGTIGSGKSTLLHTIIMSTLLRYSPEDVQIYLLDFKRGIEFKVYAESGLPNFRVVSLDTEPEFGLAVLKYLEQVQADRAQEFHDKNRDNIERYNELADSDRTDDIYKIQRIVLIIDEFHEMFTNGDSDTAKECERLLEQIIRQGRALGIHVILASQTLPDNLSRIYGQIMNRVALQSTAASAQYILDSDNDAVNMLVNVDPGKGVFNDGGGHRDANHEFRVAYFTDEQQRELLEQIKEQQAVCEQEGMFDEFVAEKPRLLLSSIQDDNENPLNRFVKSGDTSGRMEFGCPLYLGEEISMVNEFAVRLKARRAQNMLILGSEYKRANLIYGFSAMSILFDAYRRSNGRLPNEPLITFFDFGKSNTTGRVSRSNIDIMNELSARFPQLIRVFSKDSLMDGIEILTREFENGVHEAANHYVIFAGLNRARRLLDNDSAYSIPPKKMFENLVKNGPEKGCNFIVWANEPSSFLSFYGDILGEFDYRLVYDLKEEEYETVIRSTAMDTKIGSNVISYNPDEDNKKVRVYAMPLLQWFKKFMDRIEGKSSFDDAVDEFAQGEFGDDY